MTIIGIGTDIIKVKRIKAVISRSGDKFANRILSLNELLQYYNHNYPVYFLAKRFVVKEAASKALGTGIRNGLTFTQFEVYNDKLGKPSLRLFAQAANLAKKLGVTGIYVTVTDDKSYASATVIFESY